MKPMVEFMRRGVLFPVLATVGIVAVYPIGCTREDSQNSRTATPPADSHESKTVTPAGNKIASLEVLTKLIPLGTPYDEIMRRFPESVDSQTVVTASSMDPGRTIRLANGQSATIAVNKQNRVYILYTFDKDIRLPRNLHVGDSLAVARAQCPDGALYTVPGDWVSLFRIAPNTYLTFGNLDKLVPALNWSLSVQVRNDVTESMRNSENP